MTIACTEDGAYLSRTTDPMPDYRGDYTVVGIWCPTHTGSSYASSFALEVYGGYDGGHAFDRLYIQHFGSPSAGNSCQLRASAGATTSTDSDYILPSNAGPYWYSFTRSGDDLTWYCESLADGSNDTLTVNLSGSSSRVWDNQHFYIGSSQNTGPGTCEIGQHKVFSRALSIAEARAEARQYVPINVADLIGAITAIGSAANRSDDWTGHGMDMTEVGSPTAGSKVPPTFWGHGVALVEDGPGAGGGGYTLTAASGSFSVTGQDAGLRAGRLLTAQNGAFTAAGQDAGLRFGRRLTAATGTFAVTGQDAGLRAGRLLTAQTGTFAVTGFDATLVGGKTLVAGAGSFALTGFDAGLQVGRRLTAATGSFGVTGYDATLSRGRGITGGTGAFAVTGVSATLLAGRRLTAETGTFTVTGYDATLVYTARGIAAETGYFAVTGGDAALVLSSPTTALAIAEEALRVATRNAILAQRSRGRRMRYYEDYRCGCFNPRRPKPY